MQRLVPLALLLALVAAFAAPASAGSTTAPSKNLVQTAVSAGQFTTLVALVKQADLVGALSGRGQLTVFAPTDAAFAKVPKATLAALRADKAKLKAVLLYHVVKGKVTAARAAKLSSAPTLAGQTLRIRVSSGSLHINGARVVKADVLASNGVIHVIDKVLLPPTL